jgi:hypothetical protein
MASGDRHRTWFPEVVELLRDGWSCGLTGSQLIDLRNQLDAELQRIRKGRNLRPPMMNCKACGKRHPAAPPRVSVRALILAAGRFEMAPAAEIKEVERRWNRHRRAHGLDPYGKRKRVSNEG